MKAPRRQKPLAALLATLLTLSTGCSVFMATQQPGKKNLAVLSEGVGRSQVIAELGAPLNTEEKNGLKEDTFAFKQGYSTGAKVARGVFHAAADVFTCGLWEVVGTPVEAIASGTEVKVRVCYDKNDMVTKVIPYSGKEKIDEATSPPVKETIKE